ncbi:hypothetical protein LINPERPRIM_LOCUS28899 [Linum perenne]
MIGLWGLGFSDDWIVVLFFNCRVTKEKRAAGILDNHEEGEKYKEHGLRKFVRTKRPEIMPGINGFFSDPQLPGR